MITQDEFLLVDEEILPVSAKSNVWQYERAYNSQVNS